MRGESGREKELRTLLSHSLMNNLRTVPILDLLKAYNDPVKALETARRGFKGLDGKVIEEVREEEIERALGVIVVGEIKVLTILDKAYPSRLRHIHVPPPILFVRGDVRHLELVSIAIVGTRRATSYGKSVARWLGASLAKEGVLIVSGMARGIDTEAHLGCLDAGGVTVAVLGTGIDVPYPRQNRALMEKIGETGCVVSEFPPSTPGMPQNFPRRNRIISGLSNGVVVVEAPERSGALITAGFALEQGKTVFAVPGEIWSKNSKGSHLLLRDGATPVLEVQDVLDALGLEKSKSRDLEEICSKKPRGLSPKSSKLIACLNHEPLHVDEISARCDLSPADILGELLKLEMAGLVVQSPGKYFNLRRI